MKPIKPYSIKYLSITFSLAGIFISSYLIAMLNVTGIYWLFGVSLLSLFSFLIYFFLLLYNFYLYSKPIILSLSKSAWEGLEDNIYFKSFLKKHNGSIRWIQIRFSKKSWDGLYLTTIVSMLAVQILYFLNIAYEVVFKNQIYAMDMRMANLPPVVRSPDVTNFAIYVTNLAGWKTVIFTVILVSAYLIYKKHHHLSIALLAGVIIEEITAFLLKNFFDRPRPSVSQLVAVSEYSFPSGHTFIATVLFGLLAYFIYKGIDKRKNRVATVAVLIFFIIMVGLSRMYLGVHYLSDVVAGIVLGLAVVTLIVGILEMDGKYFSKQEKGDLEPEALGIIIVIVLMFNFWPTINTDILDKERIGEVQVLDKEKVDEDFLNKIPKYSETLIGSPMEPLGVIYVGNENEIRIAFAHAGWYESELPTLKNTFAVYAAGFFNKADPEATMTPSFFNAKPHDMAFSEPTDKNSVRQRHHTRLWKMNYVTNKGKEIWVSTASFDERIQIRKLVLGTHKIDPNIDKERDYIINELKNFVSESNYYRITEAHIGSNSIGDEFFTDGKAAVLVLK